MTQPIDVLIRPFASPPDIDDARELMRRYARWTGVNLCFQNFEAELAELPGKYTPPGGQLWIARAVADSAPVGVIAVRALSPTVCEMKRLWVEPEAKGTGLGRRLAQTAIDFAQSAGYREMKLDTLRERMPAAIALYRSLGFVDTEPYIANPEPDVMYMSLNLTA
jgi:ribosomal protein S18 acetylase RimI-like enzyme